MVIPVSNWNFSNDQYAWENIYTTVTNIIESLKVGGVIHPAVHSFSVGNELDLAKYGLDYTVLIPRAIEVMKKINALAPDYYMTIPVSNWRQMDFFGYFKNGDGATITPSRQTFTTTVFTIPYRPLNADRTWNRTSWPFMTTIPGSIASHWSSRNWEPASLMRGIANPK